MVWITSRPQANNEILKKLRWRGLLSPGQPWLQEYVMGHETCLSSNTSARHLSVVGLQFSVKGPLTTAGRALLSVRPTVRCV